MTEISKTADKALEVLGALAVSGATTPQRVSAQTGINRTVVQRLLTTLVHRGFVLRMDGEYSLSSRVRRLASSVEPALRRTAHPRMLRLASETQATLVLQVLDGSSAIVVDEVLPDSDQIIQARHEVASRSPLGQTASGIAILAALNQHEAEAALRRVSDADEILAKANRTRESGIFRTSNELQHGVSGIASPIRTAPGSAASLAILAPASRSHDLIGFAVQLRRATDEISAALQHHS